MNESQNKENSFDCAIHGCRTKAVHEGLCADHAGDVFLGKHHFDSGVRTKQFVPKARNHKYWPKNEKKGQEKFQDHIAWCKRERGRGDEVQQGQKWAGIRVTCKQLEMGGALDFCFLDRSKTAFVRGKNLRTVLSFDGDWRYSIKNVGEVFSIRKVGTWESYDEQFLEDPQSDAETQLKEMLEEFDRQRSELDQKAKAVQTSLELLANQDVAFRCQYFAVTHKRLAEFEIAYPEVDSMAEFMKMKIWLDANPTKRKDNYPRFVNGWLNRAQSQRTSEDRKNETTERINSARLGKEQQRAERSQQAIQNALGHRSRLADALRADISGGSDRRTSPALPDRAIGHSPGDSSQGVPASREKV